ncbi:nucleotide exchange factor GrpE [Williamsia sterculiae]|uniref:Protein GrpE n=1 Tax=Williamsia sterculiae TaxID=1344003 RepID=A0A1N7CJ51_9NOCA|nr:nucleotide exchange factor GrpE [Williamsia sterculiae]SIR63651.1 molecular chaperone GrpE [Williamsia sterculiae]
MTAGKPEGSHPDEPVTVTDRRRIDPETGDVRDAAAPDPASGATPADTATTDAPADPPAADDDPVAKVREELTGDLQRVQADYANYRRRAEKEKQSSIAYGKSVVINELLPVVDDLDRARQHGDLETSPLKGVADKLVEVLQSHGLQTFGKPGEPFDPDLHEAVQHEGDGSNPVIDAVYRQGYRFGDRTLRHAMVTVTDAPAGAATEATTGQRSESTGQ